jgi:hypothetical protein
MRSALLAVVALSSCVADDPGDPDDVVDAGPGNGVERLGGVTVCFTTENDPDNSFREETRVGLVVVADDARTEPPYLFLLCAERLVETVELLDADGARMWLGIDAQYGARELVPLGLLQLLDGAELRLRLVRGFGSAAMLSVTNGERLLVAAEANGRFTDSFGALTVENAGASGPVEPASCGDETPLALRFNGVAAANGEDVELVLGGSEVLATNLHSIDRAPTGSCTDIGYGAEATWIAVDNSL